MRSGRNAWVRGILWLLVGVLCWGMALSALATRGTRWDPQRVSYRNPASTSTMEDVRALRREIADGGHVAGWAQRLALPVSAAETGGSATVDVLYVEGDATLVWSLPVVSGQFPAEGDTEGCALDTETAQLRFGSADIVGKTVWLDGQALVVRGVFTAPHGLASLGTDPGRSLLFASSAAAPPGLPATALEFRMFPAQGISAMDMAAQSMRLAGISTAGTFDDHADEEALLAFFTELPVYLLVGFVLVELFTAGRTLTKKELARWRAMREDRLTPQKDYWRVALVWTGGLLCCAGVAVLVVSQVLPLKPMPSSYLPTRWSDFGFWRNLLTHSLQERAQGALVASLRPDMVFSSLWDWTVGLVVVSLFCIWHGRRVLLRGAHGTGLMAACLLSATLCLATPCALWLAGRAGWVPSGAAAMVGLPLLLGCLIAVARVGRSPSYQK